MGKASFVSHRLGPDVPLGNIADRSLVTTGTHCLESPQKGSSLLQRLHAPPHCFISPQVFPQKSWFKFSTWLLLAAFMSSQPEPLFSTGPH